MHIFLCIRVFIKMKNEYLQLLLMTQNYVLAAAINIMYYDDKMKIKLILFVNKDMILNFIDTFI